MDLNIKRARGFYLYDYRGTRYVDFDLSNGSALLGHKPAKLSMRLKQALDKGLWGSYNTGNNLDCENQTDKVNTEIQNDREYNTTITENVLVARAIKNLNNYIASAVCEVDNDLPSAWKLCALVSLSSFMQLRKRLQLRNIIDLTVEGVPKIAEDKNLEKQEVLFWRVYANIDLSKLLASNLLSKVQYVCTLLPFECSDGIIALYTKKSTENYYIDISHLTVAAINYMIPYVLSYGLDKRPLRVEAKNRNDLYITDLSVPANTRKPNTRCQASLKRFKFADLTLPATWRRQGIYIVLPDYTAKEYKEIFDNFLSKGFVLPMLGYNLWASENNSSAPRTLTLPQIMTAHELKNWTVACKLVC